MSDAYVPMPDTCHPFYEARAGAIRTYLHGPAVEVFNPRRVMATYTSAQEKPASNLSGDRETLVVKMCAGPAPFVGDPLLYKGWYFWRVGVDSLGRHVAGSAELDIAFSPSL